MGIFESEFSCLLNISFYAAAHYYQLILLKLHFAFNKSDYKIEMISTK